MIAHREGGKISWGRGAEAVANVIALSPPREREHPNEKPIALCAWFIGNHTDAGGLVLDPFMGSGSTGVAALQMGRRFIGIECDREHFETACRRIAAAAERPRQVALL